MIPKKSQKIAVDDSSVSIIHLTKAIRHPGIDSKEEGGEGGQEEIKEGD